MSYLNYKEIGEGPPVIILHGLLGMLDNWKTFSRQLAQDYRVISVDQRNHGRSFHADQMDYKVLAADVALLMDELDLNSASLIGHSMGGKVVMQFMVDYLERVDKAVVVDISPTGSTGQHGHIFEALLAVDIAKVTKRSEVEAQLLDKGLPLDVVYFLMKNLRRDTAIGGYTWKANIQTLYDNYENILAPIEAPDEIDTAVLFVSGGRSDYIKETDLSVISEYFPAYRHKVIEEAGHWVHAEKPQELLALVRTFFDHNPAMRSVL